MNRGRLAFRRSGMVVNNCYVSEIDKHTIKVSNANWNNEQLGNVTKWREWNVN